MKKIKIMGQKKMNASQYHNGGGGLPGIGGPENIIRGIRIMNKPTRQ